MSSYFSDLAQQYIDGEWRPGTGSWDIIDFNPYDGEKLASITIATVDEVDEAYQAAARAQKVWGATNPYARRAVFEKALRLIEEREQEITEVIIAELGGTHLKAGFELHLAKEFLRESIKLALRPEGKILPSPISAMSVMTTLSRPPGRPASSKIFATREPPTIGVFWCGLRTTPLPSARAGATDFRESRKGKLKGLITPTTPTGTR